MNDTNELYILLSHVENYIASLSGDYPIRLEEMEEDEYNFKCTNYLNLFSISHIENAIWDFNHDFNLNWLKRWLSVRTYTLDDALNKIEKARTPGFGDYFGRVWDRGGSTWFECNFHNSILVKIKGNVQKYVPNGQKQDFNNKLDELIQLVNSKIEQMEMLLNNAENAAYKRFGSQPMKIPNHSIAIQSVMLPDSLNTDRATKYFARAVEVGYMKSTATGYKWEYGGNRGKARLAYFVERVYCPTHTDTIQACQCRDLENLFGVTRLDRSLQQNADTGKSQAVKNWRADIDSKIFFD